MIYIGRRQFLLLKVRMSSQGRASHLLSLLCFFSAFSFSCSSISRYCRSACALLIPLYVVLIAVIRLFFSIFYLSTGRAPVAIAFIAPPKLLAKSNSPKANAAGCGLLAAQSFQNSLDPAGLGAPLRVICLYSVGFVCLIRFLRFIVVII